MGVDETNEVVLRSVTAKASNVDVENRISSGEVYLIWILFL
jgi:hypothetical protein